MIGAGVSQLSLLSYYAKVSKTEHLMLDITWPEQSVPPEFEHLVDSFSPSKEGSSYRKALITSLQGEFPPAKLKLKKDRRKRQEYDSDAEHDPHLLIQNISSVVDERVVDGELQFKCEFTPVESPTTKNWSVKFRNQPSFESWYGARLTSLSLVAVRSGTLRMQVVSSPRSRCMESGKTKLSASKV